MKLLVLLAFAGLRASAATGLVTPFTISQSTIPIACTDANGARISCGGSGSSGVGSQNVFVASGSISGSTVTLMTTGGGTANLPVSVSQGTMAVTGLSGAALATESSLSSLNGKVTAVNTGAVVLSAGSALAADVGLVNRNGAYPTTSTGTTINAAAGAPVFTSTSIVITGSLPAGTALLGKTGIDQTADGTTNRVNATLAAGQTLATVTTLTGITNALPAGSNLIGNVGVFHNNGAAAVTSTSTVITGSLPALSVGSALAADVGLIMRNGAAQVTSTSTVITGALPSLSAGSALAGSMGIFTNNGAINSVSSNTIVTNTVRITVDKDSTTVANPTNVIVGASTNRMGSVRLVDSADADQTSVKGTQTSRFIGVQSVNDAGRTLYIATGSLTGTVAEGMVTMGVFRAGVAAVGATSLTVTSNKTLRLTGWCLTWINRTAAAGGAFAVMRMMSTGNTIVTSPAVSVLNASTTLATVNAGATSCDRFPQGIDLTGTMTWGVSSAAIGAVAGSSITVQGYEY